MVLVNGYLTDVRLTPREREVLVLVSDLYTTDEVAAFLFISRDTVKTHLRIIYGKLGVSTRGPAVRRARELGQL